MKVLVTGATGFLGLKVCEDLIARGDQVRALGRNKKAGEKLVQLGCEFINGDLRDQKLIEKATEGVDVIVHSGALSSPWGEYKDFYDINVQGTQNVINGALKNNVKRLVHISTPSVYFNFKDRFNVKESDAIASPAPSLYTKTKLMAEGRVSEANQKGLETITLRPRGLFGPGDTTLIPRLINAHERGRLPIIGDGSTTLDITYIDNVSLAVLNSIDAPATCSGRKYNITNGEPIKLWQTVAWILAQVGREFKPKKVPFWLIYGVTGFSEVVCKYLLGGREPTLTRYTAGLLAKSQTLDITRARTELGYQPKIHMDEGLKRTLEWWKNQSKGS